MNHTKDELRRRIEELEAKEREHRAECRRCHAAGALWKADAEYVLALEYFVTAHDLRAELAALEGATSGADSQPATLN